MPMGGDWIVKNTHRFDDSDFFTRMGSEVNVKNLTSLFTSLNFECTVERDPSLERVLRTCNEVAARKNIAEMDMLVVIIMANGDERGFFMADEGMLVVEDLLRKFNNRGCPGLRGKPKLFICQGCRGEAVDHGVVQALRDGAGGAGATSEAQVKALCIG